MTTRDDLLEPVPVPDHGPERARATGDRRRLRNRAAGAGAMALVVLVIVSMAVVRPRDDDTDVMTTAPTTVPGDPDAATISVTDDGICPPGEADGTTMAMLETEASRELARIVAGSGVSLAYGSGSGYCGMAKVGGNLASGQQVIVELHDAPPDAVATFMAAHPTAARPDGLPPELDGAIVHDDPSAGWVSLIVVRPGSGVATEIDLSWAMPPPPGTPAPLADAELVAMAVAVTEHAPPLHPTNGPVITPVQDLRGRVERPTDETFEGTLTYDAATKCLFVGSAPVVWPAGSRWQGDPAGVVLGTTGEAVLVGSTFTAPGQIVPVDEAGFRAGSLAQYSALRCLGWNREGEVGFLAVVDADDAGAAVDEGACAVEDPGPGPHPEPDAEAMADLSDPDSLLGFEDGDGVMVGFVRNGETMNEAMGTEEVLDRLGSLVAVRDHCGTQVAWTNQGHVFSLDEVAQPGFDLDAAIVAHGGEPFVRPG